MMPSDNCQSLYDAYAQMLNANYPRFLTKWGIRHTAKHASGAVITDATGRRYIDCVAGYGIHNIGHNHPRLIEALIRQLGSNQLATGPLISSEQINTAEKLLANTPTDLDRCFFCNSGSEAIDTAIKLVRLHHGRTEIVAAVNSYHGFTLGALSVSGLDRFKRAYQPLLPDVQHVPFGDIEALRQQLTPRTAAVLIEPMQHEAGIDIPPRGYLQQVREACDQAGVAFILDEIKTGMAKTGPLFACLTEGVVPDILVLGKSLGGGLFPIGAVVARRSLWKRFSFSFSMSASSYAGHTLAGTAAAVTLDICADRKLQQQCTQKGTHLRQRLQAVQRDHPQLVRSVVGRGLLLGVEMVSGPAAVALTQRMISSGVMVLPTYGKPNALVLEPPLVISTDQVDQVAAAFAAAAAELEKEKLL